MPVGFIIVSVALEIRIVVEMIRMLRNIE